MSLKIYINVEFPQIKQGNNLIAGLRATNEIPPIQTQYDEKSKETSHVEKSPDSIEMQVCTYIIAVSHHFHRNFLN